MLGIAVLGAGYAGMMQLPGWKEIPGVRLIGVYDPDPARTKEASERHGIPGFDDVEALLDAPGVDAVDVATPIWTHLDLTRRAASRGKAVLCQKPMAGSYREAVELVEACEVAGVRLMTNENFRWRPWYRAVRRAIDAGTLGRLTYLRIAERVSHAIPRDNVPFAKSAGGVRQRANQERLILLEGAPHYLDCTRFLFGEPASLFARTLKIPEYAAGEVLASVSFGYPDRIAQVDMSWGSVAETGQFQPDTLTLEGTEGTLRLATSGELTHVHRSGKVEQIPLDTHDFYQRSWTAALAHFAASMIAGTLFETSGRDNLLTLRLLFESYRSAEEGIAIELAGPPGPDL